MTPLHLFPPVSQVSGLLFAAFCLGAAAQQRMGARLRVNSGAEAVLADLCSMLGLAGLRSRMAEHLGDANSDRSLFIAFYKVVCENVPQLVLQASFFALVFDELAPPGRAKMLLSIMLGLLCAWQKILPAAGVLVNRACRHGAQMNCSGWTAYCATAVPFILASLLVLWTVFKLYFVFRCDTHLWNFASGCVEST